MKIERRFFDVSSLEVREDSGKRILRGHAAVFDVLSVPIFGFREIIRRGAFAKSIQEDDIRALWNHDSSLVLGRNKSGTLRLSESDHGLEIEIDVPDTQQGRDSVELVRRGDVSQMSFGFKTVSDRWYKEDEEDRRELLEVRCFDVSPVTFPAYPDTDISARAARAAGLDIDGITRILGRANAGLEIRDEDNDLIEAAISSLDKFRKPAERQEISREARFALLRRRLALDEAQ